MIAAAELIARRGYARVTVRDVVERAGTNKPAFYRRFRDLADVVPQLLAQRHGTDEDIETGSLLGDLVEVQRRQRDLFTDPVVTGGLAGWLGEIDADPARGEPFIAGYLAPRRAHTGVLLGRGEARGEIPAGGDPAWIADLLTGPLLMRVIMPGLPPIDGPFVARTVVAALDALAYRPQRPQLEEIIDLLHSSGDDARA